MSSGFVGDLTIFVLALLVGFEVISKVPATLHTPLMSGANSIHGVVLVGVVLLSAFVTGSARLHPAVHRGCIRGRERRRRIPRDGPHAGHVPPPPARRGRSRSGRAVTDGVDTAVRLASLGGAVCFVLGLHLMNSPATARRGNQVSAFGMVVALVAVFVEVSARRDDVGGPLARAARRHSRRQRGRALLRPHGCR